MILKGNPMANMKNLRGAPEPHVLLHACLPALSTSGWPPARWSLLAFHLSIFDLTSTPLLREATVPA